jgi:hypothetical protein
MQRVIPDALAGGSLLLLVVLAVYVAGGPIKTADFWFHAKMGEFYASEGPWLTADPLLHTADEDAPTPHEWLFGVAVHGLERAVGFYGLRIVHALAVLGILALAWSIFRRESRSAVAACLATALFLVLAWNRLWQLRPDLVSISAVLLLYRLLIEPEAAPSWARVGAATVLFGVWANVHSLFAVGWLLVLAALLGVGVRAGLARVLQPPHTADAVVEGAAARARRLAAALGVGLLASGANPRGFQQHLTFWTASRDAGLWRLGDEWTRFEPLDWAVTNKAVAPLAWIATDAILALFALAAAFGFVRLLRRRSPSALRGIDPVLAGVGLASIVALLTAIRFLWMGAFALLLPLRAGRESLAARPAGAGAVRWALAVAALGLALAFPRLGGYQRLADNVPDGLRAYLAMPYVGGGYHEDGVRFLRHSGVEGNLFNAYHMGGFLGYWLGPRLRTFVDGRHPTAEILHEYFRINRQRPVGAGESSLDALDRRRVDFFFGVGLPVVGQRIYTTARLERAAGWRLVHRTLDDAIYLRIGARNRENLGRIAAYYESEGVPFDPEAGFDPWAAIRARPDWAAARGMWPPSVAASWTARESPDPDARFRALDTLGWCTAFLGSYAAQVEADRAAVALRPEARSPRRRMVAGLLRLDRAHEAVAAARALAALDPEDPRSAEFVRVAVEYERRRSAGPAAGARAPIDAPVNALPLITTAELLACCADFLQ